MSICNATQALVLAHLHRCDASDDGWIRIDYTALCMHAYITRRTAITHLQKLAGAGVLEMRHIVDNGMRVEVKLAGGAA